MPDQVVLDREKIQIPCGPMQNVLDEFDIKHVDFMSLDVEMRELEVLKTIDFARTRIDVIVMETMWFLYPYDQSDGKNWKELNEFLGENGFVMDESARIQKNHVWVHKESGYLTQKIS